MYDSVVSLSLDELQCIPMDLDILLARQIWSWSQSTNLPHTRNQLTNPMTTKHLPLA